MNAMKTHALAAAIAAGIDDDAIIDRRYGRKDAATTEDLNKIEKAVKEQLERINEQVKEFVTKNKDKIENGDALAKSVKESVDKLLTDQGTLSSRLQGLEQKIEKAARDRDTGDEGGESVKFFIEKKMDELKALVNREGLTMRSSVNIPMSLKALTNTGVTGTALNYPGQQILSQPLPPLLRRLRIRDLLAGGRTNKAVLWYQRESGFTNNAAPVSEGSLKPKSEITFELITENVRTIAHTLDVSLQMLDDVDFIASYVEGRMRYGLDYVEDVQLLTGSGTGQNLEGIYTAATAYAQPSGVDLDPTKETDIDKLRLAILQVELAEAGVTGMVLHPTNWANIELIKTTFNSYLFANPQGTVAPRLWGRDVVTTQAMTLGRFLVGDFRAHAQIFDRQDANLAISFENKDNFERNMATMRVEKRLALAIYRPEAFVKGVLESAS